MKIFNSKLFYILILILSIISGLSLLAFKYYYWQVIDGDIFYPANDLWVYLLIPFFLIGLMSFFYACFNLTRFTSLIPITICVLSAVGTLYAPYEVLYIDIYNAFSEDGHDAPHNKFKIIEKLKLKQYEWLDNYLLAVHKVADENPNKENYLNTAYLAFKIRKDTSLRVFFDEWVAKRNSFQAYTARAFYLHARGWEVRSQKFFRDIPKKNQVEMTLYFNEAAADLNKALNINSKNAAAYMKLIATYGVLGDTDKADQVLKSALRIYPYAYYVRSMYMYYHLYPQWGGSREQMMKFAIQAREYAVHNPRLVGLIASVYENDAGLLENKKNIKGAVQLYKKTLEYAPFNSVFMALASIYYAQSNTEKQIAQYNNVLNKSPFHFTALASRLRYILKAGDVDMAVGDANTILEFDDNDWDLMQAAWAFETAGKDNKAIQAYRHSLLSNNKSVYSYKRLIALYQKKRDIKKALEIAVSLEVALPDEPIGWLYAADFMYDLNLKESVKHINQYYHLIDNGAIEETSYKASATRLRKDIKQKFGDSIGDRTI